MAWVSRGVAVLSPGLVLGPHLWPLGPGASGSAPGSQSLPLLGSPSSWYPSVPIANPAGVGRSRGCGVTGDFLPALSLPTAGLGGRGLRAGLRQLPPLSWVGGGRGGGRACFGGRSPPPPRGARLGTWEGFCIPADTPLSEGLGKQGGARGPASSRSCQCPPLSPAPRGVPVPDAQPLCWGSSGGMGASLLFWI